MGFNLDDYEPVADRIERFWKDHTLGSITTDLIDYNVKHFIVKASVWRLKRSDDVEWSTPDSTGYAEEVIGSTNVNRTSALENCETSAIGRALANLGYAVKNRASREEMVKAQPAPRPRSGGRVSPSKPQSPESHEDAPRTNGSPEVVTTATVLKRELLDAVDGDKAKAGMIWREVVGTFGYEHASPIPDDMKTVIREALQARTFEPVLGGTDPANGTS